MRLPIERARRLRRTETTSEKLLWPHLRDRRMCGCKFRRQYPVGPYCLDFACCELKLGVELDGAGHADQREYDFNRDAYLRRLGWKILRFGNDDVVLRLHPVLEVIHHQVGLMTMPR